MRRLLASDLLPKRAGQPAKALVHIHFTELPAMDKDSAFQDAWIADHRARRAAHRAAASVGPSGGGAWLTGDAARSIACDAMIIPVVTGDLDPSALEDLISQCVQYDHARARHPQPGQPAPTDQQARAGHPAHRLVPAPEHAGTERPVTATGRRPALIRILYL